MSDASWLDELLGSADAGLPAAAGTVKHSGVGRAADAASGPAAGPQAVKLDRWALRRGGDCLAQSRELRLILQDGRPAATVEAEAADLHAMVFEASPELLPSCGDASRLEYLQGVAAQAGYPALHEACRGDDVVSVLGTVSLAQGLAEFRKAKAKAGPPPGAREKPHQRRLREAQEAMAAGTAALSAVRMAQKEAERLETTREAMGFSTGGTGQAALLQRQELKRAFAAVRNSPFLTDIMDRAGQMLAVARGRQRAKPGHGVEELVGTALDGDPARLLPSELAQLSHPAFRLDVLRRLAERQALCRDYKAPEERRQGPIMVWCDCSDSMRDFSRIYQAKALSLALAWVAKRQSRWVSLVNFSRSYQSLALPPGQWDDQALAAWLESFEKLGTNLPMRADLMERFFAETGAPRGKTDLVIVTDGQWSSKDAGLGPHGDAAARDWLKANRVKVFTVALDCGAGDPKDPTSLASFSDEVFEVSGLAAHSDAVGEILSL